MATDAVNYTIVKPQYSGDHKTLPAQSNDGEDEDAVDGGAN